MVEIIDVTVTGLGGWQLATPLAVAAVVEVADSGGCRQSGGEKSFAKIFGQALNNIKTLFERSESFRLIKWLNLKEKPKCTKWSEV